MPGIFWMIKTISGLGNLLECELHSNFLSYRKDRLGASRFSVNVFLKFSLHSFPFYGIVNLAVT